MVIVRIQEGLGNQLFQYAVGRSLARRLDTQLWLDTSHFLPQALRRFGLDQFRISARILGPRGCYWLRKIKKDLYSPLRGILGMAGIFDMMVDKKRGFERLPRRAARILYLDGYWQSEKYFAADREQLLDELAFCAPAAPELEPMLTRLGAEPSVCVHVRRGDYVSTPYGLNKHAACGLDYYHSAMAYVSARVAGAKFYLFSDDPPWLRANFFPSENLVIASGESGRGDLDDFRLMMNCRHFIIANSSFSWWAAWLGRQPDKIVVAPRQWYCSSEFTEKDLVPEPWVRL
jgi:hypothetical protein